MNLNKLLACILCASSILCGCASGTPKSDTQPTQPVKIEEKQKDQKENKQKNVYGLGETFTFDGMEITLGKDYEFTKVENQYSDANGADVIKLPVTVKNVSDDFHSLNFLYYRFIGSKGTAVEMWDGLFDYDEGMEFAKDMRPDASETRYFFIEYDGDGTYSILFDNFDKKVEAQFQIKK